MPAKASSLALKASRASRIAAPLAPTGLGFGFGFGYGDGYGIAIGIGFAFGFGFRYSSTFIQLTG
ncbi:hypothetical protein PS874_01886 [Pseudomonas fluorescens]|nr:hypothetical protein PS874_01886 [Pseudomonas fluorescens]